MDQLDKFFYILLKFFLKINEYVYSNYLYFHIYELNLQQRIIYLLVMLNMLKSKFKLTIIINHFLLNFKIYFTPLLNNQPILLME